MLTKYRLTPAELNTLRKETKKYDIKFLCSAFDYSSLNSLTKIGCTEVKIPSCCNEDFVMLDYSRDWFSKIYISTGMRVFAIAPLDSSKWVVLQCTSAYPCPYNQVNLRASGNCDGLSDHTAGWHVSLAAVALGARVIEKHFTTGVGGPDKDVALSIREFNLMVKQIRDIEQAMGDGIKKIEEAERGLLWRKTF